MIKKILYINRAGINKFGAFLYLFLLIPAISFSAEGDGLVPCGKGAEPCKFEDLFGLIKNIFDTLIIIVAPIAMISIAIAGIKYVSAGANPKNATEAKEILWMALGGLALAIAAWAIVNTVLTVLKGDAVGFLGRLKN